MSAASDAIARQKPGLTSTSQAVIESANYLEAATFDEHQSLSSFLQAIDKHQLVFYRALKTQYPDGYAKLLSLKIANLFVARYHFIERHTILVSSPIQLLVDPSNACQLQCPGCVHTSNQTYKNAAGFDWPSGNLSIENFEKLIKPYAPFAMGVVFYNYGEPLLNKNTPAMIRRSKDFLLNTAVSSNLSMPKLNTEAIVRSGLNHLEASIDGVTQETYEVFRRRGNLNVAFSNIKDIVKTKDDLNSSTPNFHWVYLTFEHNVEEVDQAIKLGRQLGVNQITIVSPFSVRGDDPGIREVVSDKEGLTNYTPNETAKGPLDHWTSFEKIDAAIEISFSESWLERGRKLQALNQASNRSSQSTCGWLYKSMTMDALGRIMPCCMAPAHDKNLVYGKLGDSGKEGPYNVRDLSKSRLSFADRALYQEKIEQEGTGTTPYCASCKEDPELTYNMEATFSDLCYYDPDGVFDRQIFQRLTQW